MIISCFTRKSHISQTEQHDTKVLKLCYSVLSPEDEQLSDQTKVADQRCWEQRDMQCSGSCRLGAAGWKLQAGHCRLGAVLQTGELRE